MSEWNKFHTIAKKLIELYIKEAEKDPSLVGKVYAYKGHQIFVEPVEEKK